MFERRLFFLALLMGVDPGTHRRLHRTRLAPGALLLLYTDGLVERRG